VGRACPLCPGISDINLFRYLEKVAPATLKTEFEGEWSKSPAWMFYDRRKRQSSYGSYGESTFHASEERHQMPIAP
jgi:hypothetical protein